jgi:hypothetical protein
MVMPDIRHTAAAVLILSLLAQPALAGTSELYGRWILNHELTSAEQPDGPEQRALFSGLPQTSVSVGGVPLPGSGGSGTPPVPGSSKDPDVLRCGELTIEPLGDKLHLTFVGVNSVSIERGDDQGLISRWSDRKLTSRYETTTRKVNQSYEVRRDGRMLVTVKLNPNRGATVIHKRVFERAAD